MNFKISENIKWLRKAKKITQEGLAEIFNVTHTAVSKWENKKNIPWYYIVISFITLLCVSIDELMGYDNMLIVEEIQKAKE